jgi:MFS family permease
LTNGTPSAGAAIPLPPRQFRNAMATVYLLILMTALDQMAVSVALPSIAASLGGVRGIAWVITAFLLASTVVTPIFGKLGDIYGRPAALSVAIALFIAGAAAGAASNSLSTLLIARLVQGAGGGGLVVLAQSVVADVVPLRERGKYQGYTSIVWAVSSVIGPFIGGLLTAYLSWRWIFGLNLPLGLVAWYLVKTDLGALRKAQKRQRVDWTGAAMLFTGVTSLWIPITLIGEAAGQISGASASGLMLAGAMLLLFWRRQGRIEAPLLPLTLLKHPIVILGCACSFVSYLIFVGMCMLVPMRQQLVAGSSTVDAGTTLMWMTLTSTVAVFLGGRWMTRTGKVRPLQRTGAILAVLSLAWLAASEPTAAWSMAGGLIILGCALGFQIPTAMLMMQNSVPRDVIGTATGLLIFSRAIGGTVGIALLSSLVFSTVPAGFGTAASGVSANAIAKVSDTGFMLALCAQILLSAGIVALGRRLPDTRLHGGG